MLAIVMKLVLIMPCVDKNLTKIREGWERNPRKESGQDSSISIKQRKLFGGTTRIFVGSN